MSYTVKTLAGAACLLFAALAGLPAAAQVINVVATEHTGTLAGLENGTITVKTATGDFVGDLVNRDLVDLGNAKIEFRAEETRDFIKPGMIVRFDADVEVKRRLKRGEIAEFTILAAQNPPRPAGPGRVPPPGLRPGLGPGFGLPELGPPADAGPAYELGLFPIDFEEERDGRGRIIPPKLARYTIVGLVTTGVKRGAFSVAVPDDEGQKKTIKVVTATDAVVHVRSSDLSLAKPGDKVHVKGMVPADGNQRMFFATHVTITRGDEIDVPEKVADRGAFGAPTTEPGEEGGKFKGVILKVN